MKTDVLYIYVSHLAHFFLGCGYTGAGTDTTQATLEPEPTQHRLHWSRNRHNTANQHLSGYTLQERVATFNPDTRVQTYSYTRPSCSQPLVHFIAWVVGSLQRSRTTST